MKTLRNILPLFLITSFFLSSCEDDPENPTQEPAKLLIGTALTANGGQSYEIGDTIPFDNGIDFNLKLFKLYLSQISLIDQNNEKHLIKDIVLLDIGKESLGEVLINNIPAGNYKAIELGLGVDSVLNNSDPLSFDSDHPLSSYNQMYWSMLKYRFAVLEGRSNNSGQLGSSDDKLNAYHPGTDPLYRVIRLDYNLNMSENTTTPLPLTFDLDYLFNSIDAINLLTDPQTHSEPIDIHIAIQFMDQLEMCVSVDIPLNPQG